MSTALFEIKYDLAHHQGENFLTQPELNFIRSYKNKTKEEMESLQVQYPWYWKEVLVRVE